MENMEIYEAGRQVPKEATRPFNNGKFNGTDINPMWRIKKLTELFGPAGVGWYYEVISERAEAHGDVTIAVVDINLYVKVAGEWSKPIYGTGGNILLRKGSTSDEGYKMALTDALSVACKALGIGADVYFGQDKTKYTNGAENPPQPEKKAEERCEGCGAVIGPWFTKDGAMKMSAAEVAEKSRLNFDGKTLCINCIKKEQARAKNENQ